MNPSLLIGFAVCFSSFGFILSLTGNIYCETIEFKPSSLGESSNFTNLNMGLWSVRRKALFKIDPIFDDPFFAVGNTCVGYPNGSKFDTKWNSSIGLSITSWVLAGLAGVSLCMTSCVPKFKQPKILAMILLIITLFQGLTLLVLSSDNCKADKNPVFLAFPQLQQYYADGCTMGRGTSMNIAATVLYFLAAVALLVMPRDEDTTTMPPPVAGEDVADKDVEDVAPQAEEQPLEEEEK